MAAGVLMNEIANEMSEILNPFSHNVKMSMYDKIKVGIMTVTVLPVRVALMFIFLSLAALLATLGLMGVSYEELQKKPMGTFRRRYLKAAIWICLRAMLFVAGFYRVRVRGRQALRRDAPILIMAPHSSFFDLLPVLLVGGISSVAKEETKNFPFFGNILTYTQPVYVKREDPKSRQNAIEKVCRRAWSEDDWDQIVIFPEGTCTNRTSLVTFKPGGFYPGVPVQPICLHYPNRVDTVTWTWEGVGTCKLIWLTLCQFVNYCQVEFLPVYVPSKEEQLDAKMYANNLRRVMSRAMGLPLSDWAYDDIKYASWADDWQLPYTLPIIRIIKLRNKLGLDQVSTADAITVFIQAAKGKWECNVERFAHLLGVTVSDVLKDFFNLFDQERLGLIDGRSFVCGLWLLRRDLSLRRRVEMAFRVFGLCDRIDKEAFVIIAFLLLNIKRRDALRIFSALDPNKNELVICDDFLESIERAEQLKKLIRIRESFQTEKKTL